MCCSVLLAPPPSPAPLPVAAVMGRHVQPELLAAAVELPRGEADALLAELAGAGVLVVHGEGWAFSHVLVRDVVDF